MPARNHRHRLPGPLSPAGGQPLLPDPEDPEIIPDGEAVAAGEEAAVAVEVVRDRIDFEEEEIARLEEEAARRRRERAEREERSRLKVEAAAERRRQADASALQVNQELNSVIEEIRATLPGSEAWWPKVEAAMQAHGERMSGLRLENGGELTEFRPAEVLGRHAISVMLPLIRMLGARSA